MKILINFLILLSFSFSCKSVNVNDNKSDSVIFTFRKTMCKGKCPVYYMEIFKSGKIIYDGIRNVEKIGKFTKTIDVKKLDSLIVGFENAKFCNFENEYTSRKRDLPTTYISYICNDTVKTVRDYDGGPKELKNLEKKLEYIANSNDWVKSE